MPRARVDGCPGGFVNNQQVFVLEDTMQRTGDREYAAVRRGVPHQDGQKLAGFRTPADKNGDAVQQNAAGYGLGPLYGGAREIQDTTEIHRAGREIRGDSQSQPSGPPVGRPRSWAGLCIHRQRDTQIRDRS